MDKAALGLKIKKAREEKGITQEALAEAINYSPDHISVIERGVQSPRLEKLIEIANTLEVSIDYLLGDDLIITSKIESSMINNKINSLPVEKQRLILKVLDTMIND